MILKLKKGKGSDVIKTIDGGVGFIEGEETVIDYSRVLKEELARIKENYDIVDERVFDVDTGKIKEGKKASKVKEEVKVQEESKDF